MNKYSGKSMVIGHIGNISGNGKSNVTVNVTSKTKTKTPGESVVIGHVGTVGKEENLTVNMTINGIKVETSVETS